MDLELAAALVEPIDSSKVPDLRREEENHEINMASITEHARMTRNVSRSLPSHVFTSVQKPKTSELLERPPIHVDLDV